MSAIMQETIQRALEGSPLNALFVIFWGAAVLSLSSCTVVRMPIVVGYVAGVSNSKKKAFLLTAFFVFGLLTSYTVLGIVFGISPAVMKYMMKYSRFFYYFLGVFSIFIGVQVAGLITFGNGKDPHRIRTLHPKLNGYFGAYLLGFLFSIFEAPTCPCCGPVLFVISGMCFAKGKILYSIAVFFVYALGQSLPVFITGALTGIVKYMNPDGQRVEPAVRLVAGNILMAIGIYFLLVA